ncbi:MAG TPA: MaoC family dehydratase [Solirubrobacteraceae bacterium]|jgi:acyl dehydratase|nr:MaoC family dehydratase [Solirubrobacteraceae bacterium]
MTASAQRGDDVGPFFDELRVGQRIDSAPALSLTPGHAALHQAIVADRLRLCLDAGLSADVIGAPAPLAHPALVWDVAIGQSTLVTRRVIANLFYRGLVFRRAPVIGDTLHTTTEVVALRQNSRKPGRSATGMAVLRVQTADQAQRPVLDFWRCAMLPLADPDGQTGAADDLDAFSAELDPASLDAAIAGWRLDAYRNAVGGRRFEDLAEGETWTVEGGDVVSSAPELARLTLNVATAHHDATGNGRRLVYGGHTIGLAASQLTRVLPDLVTIVAWHGCDHLAPVLEGDTLTSELELERRQPLPAGGGLVHLRSRVHAHRGSDDHRHPVLDWRLVGVMS